MAVRAFQASRSEPLPPAVIAALEDLEAVRREHRLRWRFYKRRERAQPPRPAPNRLGMARLVAGILVKHAAITAKND